jgi:ATP-dependent exoDNAse (exonuclease V) beta subunit
VIIILKQRSLPHKGGIYIFGINQNKIENLCSDGLKNIKSFLYSTFKDCPDKLFNSGPRSSQLKLKFESLKVTEIKNHEVSLAVKKSFEKYNEIYRTAHSKVQMFMLENDLNTIAMEIPIWLYPSEINGFESLFNSKEALTGHIDLLKVEDGLIWIWDYKPNAQKEEFASTQTYFYAIMLSKRTNIPLEKIRCGYFDENFTYVFKPDETFLKELANTKDLTDF